MPYELRIGGRPPQVFETEPEAVTAASAALRENPNAEPEVIDLNTGQPAAPGASKAEREGLKGKVGY